MIFRSVNSGGFCKQNSRILCLVYIWECVSILEPRNPVYVIRGTRKVVIQEVIKNFVMLVCTCKSRAKVYVGIKQTKTPVI